MRVRVLGAIAVCGLLSAMTPAAHAWGCRGHETVAALAEKHLTPEVKTALTALLMANPIDPSLKRYCGNANPDPFQDASTWADDERTVDSSTGPWHFIDIPLSAKLTGSAKGNANAGANADVGVNARASGGAMQYCGAQGCVLSAITQQLAILKDKSATAPKRAAALRYIIHFVGDLHQPLHDESNGDRGGNCVPVKYFSRNPHERNNNYTPNLHHVWDTEIPEAQMQGASPGEFADKLDSDFSGSFPQWQRGPLQPGVQLEAQLERWIWEGHEHAVDTAYGALGTPIANESDAPLSSCADNNNIGQRMLHKHIVIGAVYQGTAGAVAEERLAQAGFRLAMILNDAAKGGL